MTRVMEEFLDTYPGLPGELQALGFLQSHAVQHALNATRAARISSGTPDLWHDPKHTGSTPVVDLPALQQDPDSPEWQDLFAQLKPRAMGLLRGEGAGEQDAEDVFAESMAGMVKPRQSGPSAIDDLLVYEQLPPLFLCIVRRRLVNHIRYRQAEKRAVRNTLGMEHDAGDVAAAALTVWEAEAADPMGGLTLARLAEECAHLLSPLQQHILTTLYLEETATYMEVAQAPWFANAVDLKPNASDATRRRALDTEHDSALDSLARALGINRQKS